MRVSSGLALARWPQGGRVWLTDKLLDLTSKLLDGDGEWLPEAALLGVYQPPSSSPATDSRSSPSGRLVVFGDSNCVDTVRTVDPCWQLMRHMLLCAAGGEPPASAFWERGWSDTTMNGHPYVSSTTGWQVDHDKFLALLSSPLRTAYVAPGVLGRLPKNSFPRHNPTEANAHLRRGRPSMSTTTPVMQMAVSASDFESNSNSPFFSGILTCTAETQ